MTSVALDKILNVLGEALTFDIAAGLNFTGDMFGNVFRPVYSVVLVQAADACEFCRSIIVFIQNHGVEKCQLKLFYCQSLSWSDLPLCFL